MIERILRGGYVNLHHSPLLSHDCLDHVHILTLGIKPTLPYSRPSRSYIMNMNSRTLPEKNPI